MKTKKKYLVSAVVKGRKICQTVLAYTEKQAGFLFKKENGWKAWDMQIEESPGAYKQLSLF